MTSRRLGKRRLAREMAVQMLYQQDLGGSALTQIFATFDPTGSLRDGEDDDTEVPKKRSATEAQRPEVEAAFDYAKTLVQGTLDHLDEIDALIQTQADNWRLERMPAVDRNILRLAVYELLYETDIPKLVVVDEAIDLAKEFGAEQSGSFVNGLLDGLLREHTFPGALR